jgi:hypothetical protein
LKYFRLYADIESNFAEINCPQTCEKAWMGKSEI